MFYLYVMLITMFLFYLVQALFFWGEELASHPIFEIFHYVFWPIGLPLLVYKTYRKLAD